MAVVTTNLGTVTAYGDAVAAGYTGTKAEWQALMASYATVGQTAVDAKDVAVQEAAKAVAASNVATQKASEASNSAQTITQSAEQIQTNTDDIAELKEDVNASRLFIALDEYTKTNKTHNGVTYTLSSDGNRYHVQGTASSGSFYNLWHDYTSLPDGISASNNFFVKFTMKDRVFVRILFYANGSTSPIANLAVELSQTISVPSNAVGMTIRFYLNSGFSANTDVLPPLLIPYRYRSIFAPIASAPPRFFSIIDDDTSSDDLVTKFYQACKHNGITGSYAVITGRYASGTNSISLLKSYVNDGFGTLLHCADQQQYLNTSSATFDRVRAIENYMQAIDDFKTLGLVNSQNAIVMPYGNYDNEAKGIAKDMGFDLAFSTRFTRCNSVYEYDRYGLYRCGLSASADVSDDTDVTVRGTMATCKARIDELATSVDGGWLVLVTHFNTWQNETWDSTLDSNGYPVGYSRFNTLVEYAKNAGLVPISMMQGMSFIKPFLYSNEANQ